ncbi:DUF3558 family protein [Amycolatopsis cynarae]|uniref:DUF3558 family protein n=1 Tax=Amycolatopsis cynarae TaxID=2995223 RepID=A0ABY7AYD0_9PSEU|nr:DUF3558 family protein [Amycolatopsis sp. HUAS 11-8]WAL65020.1 DUF3558 family protein [Amycolatopsis sp. HUAS 11-8]
MRLAALAATFGVAALALTACADTPAGRVPPAGHQSASLSFSAPSTTVMPNVATGLNACTLLTDTEAKQIAPGVGAHQDLGDLGGKGVSSCRWSQSTANDTLGHVFSITMRPTQAIDGLAVKTGGQLSHATTPEGRQAVVIKNNGFEGDCLLSIAVGSGRIDINDATATTDGACVVVSKVSDYVEPRLPKS